MLFCSLLVSRVSCCFVSSSLLLILLFYRCCWEMKLACPLKLLSFSLLSIGLLLGSLAEGAGPRETEEAGTRITKTRTTRTTRPRIIIHSSNTNSKTQIKLLHQGKGSLINNSEQHQQPIIISNSNDINKDEIEGPTTNHKKGELIGLESRG